METIQIEIKSNAPQVEKETTSLRQQVRELRKEMESCAVGSKEYNDALAKLATTTHDFKDQQEEIRNSAGDLGTALSNVQGVATGIVSGFSAVNAVMTLTGSNTENLQKAMVSLQAGIALVQGMEGLEGLPKKINATVTSLKSLFTATTKETAANGAMAASQGILATATKGVANAFKGLKAALISSGIGGIIVLIGALVSGMTALVGVIRNNLQAENEFKDANEQLNQSFEAQNHALDNEIKLMKASGKSQEEIIKAKQKLTAAQIKETEATLENAKARLTQLKNDSAWKKFWHGENKVIKELEKETIPQLEANLASLKTKATDLTYEYKEAEINTQNELKKNREQAANNAIQTAKRVADERKKFLGDVEKTAEESFKKILEEYKSMLGNIKTARESILSTNTVSQAISDIQAFGLVYGTDFNKFDKQLQGVQNALISDAIDAAAKERDRQLAEKFGDKDAEDKIKAEYAQFLNDLYDMIDSASSDAEPIHIDIAPALIEVEDEVESFRNSISDKAKAISEEFTNRFNALNSLYNDGVITYEEYFDTLQKVQNDYLTATDNFEKEYVSKVSGCEQRVAELRYQYAIKPLEFQKEVGEKFLQELDKQHKDIEREIDTFYTGYNTRVIDGLKEQLDSTKPLIKELFDVYSGTTTLTQRYEDMQAELDRQKTLYDLEYQLKVDEINKTLALNTLTVEQETALKDQLATLNAEKLQNDVEYYSNSTAAKDEYYASLRDTVTQSMNAFGDLTNNLANVFKQAAETMKDSEGNYTKEGKKMLETSAALQIATATMNAASGIATVWATSAQLGPIAGPIVAGIQTATHIANLAVQIMSIKKALSQGLAGDTSGGSASAPDTSFTLTSPDAYQNTLSDEVQSDLQANAQSNQRVYVLESDITSKQDNVKSAVTTSTF